jgi:hypothetical protein
LGLFIYGLRNERGSSFTSRSVGKGNSGSCTAQASKKELAYERPDIIKMDKKEKHAPLCKSALHNSLACKN